MSRRRDGATRRGSWSWEDRSELMSGPVVDPPRPSRFASEAEAFEAYRHFRDDFIDYLQRPAWRRYGRPAPWAVERFEPELLELYPRAPLAEQVRLDDGPVPRARRSTTPRRRRLR